MRAPLDKAVAKTEEDHLTIKTALGPVSAQALYASVIYCLHPQMDYLAQIVYPSLTREAFGRFDQGILGFLEHTLGTPMAKQLDSEGPRVSL